MLLHLHKGLLKFTMLHAKEYIELNERIGRIILVHFTVFVSTEKNWFGVGSPR
jgi:hypothetical protein